MASIDARLADARHRLVQAGIAPADVALDAEVLARAVLGWDRAQLLARGRDPIPDGFDDAFDAALARRLSREPVAYILGRREFWGLDFEVTRDVLIPRPDTELIVEEALSSAAGRAPYPHIVDVGTGSGCLAIALATEYPSARVTATDVSAAALEVARRNAARHRVDDRVSFVLGDLFGDLATEADLIVSNPPYVPASDAATLAPDVVRFEPSGALFGGRDGLAVLRRLFAEAPRHLAADGRMIAEFGFGQSRAVEELARTAGWTIAIRDDLQSIPRVAVLRR